MTARAATLLGRLMDLVLPGSGMLWLGRRSEGWNAILAWAFLPSLMAAAVALLELDPRRAFLALGVLYLAMQLLLWLAPGTPALPPRGTRAVAGVLVYAALAGLAVAALSRSVTFVTIPDHGLWPGLLPGERVLVRRADFVAHPPEAGELVAARTPKGVVVARVVALGGDLLEVSGPSVRRNGIEVAADDLGELALPVAGEEAPEAKDLRAWRERFDESEHLVFFRRGVSMAPVRAVVDEGSVFLLADNRSTADAADSRQRGPVALSDLLGRPDVVLWSPAPGTGTRWERIGTRWP